MKHSLLFLYNEYRILSDPLLILQSIVFLIIFNIRVRVRVKQKTTIKFQIKALGQTQNFYKIRMEFSDYQFDRHVTRTPK